MSTLQSVIIGFAECNLHFCLYGALGAHFLLRAILAIREHKFNEFRDYSMHGIMYFLFGLL